MLKPKLALTWTGYYKTLAVGPYSAAVSPDGCPFGDTLLIFDLPPGILGLDAMCSVSVVHTTPPTFYVTCLLD